MIEDYTKAWHMGESQYRRDITFGRYPYLTALDDAWPTGGLRQQFHATAAAEDRVFDEVVGAL